MTNLGVLMRQVPYFSVVFLCFCGVTQSSAQDTFSSHVDAIFAEFDSADVPGCAVGIIRDGTYIHARATVRRI